VPVVPAGLVPGGPPTANYYYAEREGRGGQEGRRWRAGERKGKRRAGKEREGKRRERGEIACMNFP